MIDRASHEDYRQQQRILRRADPARPRREADKPWDELTEEQKEDNRLRADEFDTLLNQLGYEIRPLTNWDAELIKLTGDEVEELARLEHDRWREAKRGLGWKPGRPRNDGKRIHDELVPWEALGETTVDKVEST